MNREAAALGVPVYSIFRGKLGAVDRYLAREGRLVLIENREDVRSKSPRGQACEGRGARRCRAACAAADPECRARTDGAVRWATVAGPFSVHLVCGARPNFMKVAPLYHALAAEPWAAPVIVHTGQHYDANMSGSFFSEFGLPEPHVSLGVGSGSHAEQTARVMVAYEKVLQEQRPDLVVVVGDVNSTMAATLAASKLGIKVAHLEAGLRSFDRTHAGGDQPAGHRCAGGHPVDPVAGCRRQSARGRDPGGAHPDGREHHDRLPGDAQGPHRAQACATRVRADRLEATPW